MSRRSKKTNGAKEKRKITYFIFPLISLVIVAFCLVYIIQWFNENGANQEVLNNLYGETVQKNEDTGETKIDFAKLKQKNSDTCGWLTVNNTNIDYPVVKGENNSYYVSKNFNKEDNIAGWIFADYRLKLDGTDKNTVIYGHNMKDGSMFGTLKKALNKDWYNKEENLKITYRTSSEILTYKVFSVYQIEKESYYTKPNFSSNEEYQTFLDTLKSRSVKNFGTSVTVNDKILTLSTCASNSNYRVVLHAVLVNQVAGV